METRCSSTSLSAPGQGGACLVRPYVLINMSMTVDGKIASANRRVTSFGSRADLEHLYSLRSTADAVMCGALTVRECGVTLDVGPTRYRRKRRDAGLPDQPLRIVVSGTASLPAHASILQQDPSSVLVITTTKAPKRQVAALQDQGARVIFFGARGIDLPAALAWLKRDLGVKRLLCEGGSVLNGSLLAAGLVDEIHLTLCPFILGGKRSPCLAEHRLPAQLVHALGARLESARRRGDELFLVYRLTPVRPGRQPPSDRIAPARLSAP